MSNPDDLFDLIKRGERLCDPLKSEYLVGKRSCRVIIIERGGGAVIPNQFVDNCAEITVKRGSSFRLATNHLTINFERVKL